MTERQRRIEHRIAGCGTALFAAFDSALVAGRNDRWPAETLVEWLKARIEVSEATATGSSPI